MDHTMTKSLKTHQTSYLKFPTRRCHCGGRADAKRNGGFRSGFGPEEKSIDVNRPSPADPARVGDRRLYELDRFDQPLGNSRPFGLKRGLGHSSGQLGIYAPSGRLQAQIGPTPSYRSILRLRPRPLKLSYLGRILSSYAGRAVNYG